MRVMIAALVGSLGLLAGQASAGDLAQHYARMTPALERSEWVMNDPSRIVDVADGQIVAVTGRQPVRGYRCGLEIWKRADALAPWRPHECVLAEKPAWFDEELIESDGVLTGPDFIDADTLVYSGFDGEFGDYSCVGLARRIDGVWTDSGKPLSCVQTWLRKFLATAISPSVLTTADGDMYLYAGGGLVHGVALDPETLRPIPDQWVSLETRAGPWSALARGFGHRMHHHWAQSAFVHEHEGLYYLFLNWGVCCRGVRSTYEIRVGRSDHPLGPFRDQFGRDMVIGAGKIVLARSRQRIGPGQPSLRVTPDGRTVMAYHYYDPARGGLPWLGEVEIGWEEGWPVPGDVLR